MTATPLQKFLGLFGWAWFPLVIWSGQATLGGLILGIGAVILGVALGQGLATLQPQQWGLGVVWRLIALGLLIFEFAPSLIFDNWHLSGLLIGCFLWLSFRSDHLDPLPRSAAALMTLGISFSWYVWGVHLSSKAIHPANVNETISWLLMTFFILAVTSIPHLPRPFLTSPALSRVLLIIGGLGVAFFLAESLLRQDTIRRHWLGGYPLTVLPEYTIPRQHEGYLDYSLPKSQDKQRILIIGDSFAYGYGVMPHDRFPALLQAHDPLEIIVSARPAENTLHQLNFWRAGDQNLQADLVIVAVVINDVEVGDLTPEPPAGFLRRWLPKSQLAYFLEVRHIFSDNWWTPAHLDESWEAEMYANTAHLAVWEQAVQVLYAEITATGAQAWAYILIRPDDLTTDSARAFYGEKYAYLAETFQAAGFWTVNFWDSYLAQYGEQDYRDLCAFPNDCHPNPELHQFYAEQIWVDWVANFTPAP